MLKEGFKEVCSKAATIGNADWVNTRKSLKKEVKTWVRTSKTPNQMIKEIESDMHKLNSVQPDQYDKEKVRELQAEHDRCLLMQEYYWHQRSRINWALFGDSNTKFYHASATTRKRRNSITAIQNSDGEWETGVKEIRSAFIAHFRGIYTAGHRVPISQLISVSILQDLNVISAHAHPHLNSRPTAQEIKSALFSLGPDKAAGPDGINAKLIQSNWESFGPAVTREVQHFFQTSRMPPYLSRSNIILVPKKDEASKVQDYRPISVCNVVYKVI